MPTESVDTQLVKVAQMEMLAAEALEALHSEYPDVFKRIEEIQKQNEGVQKLKDAIKQRLIEEKDFDLHEIGNLSVSLSAVAKVKLVDIDQVPEDFKETKTVLKEKKAREYLKLMHRAPAGCEDNSFYRLNWKIKPDKQDSQDKTIEGEFYA